MFNESEACTAAFDAVHWFKAGELPEGSR